MKVKFLHWYNALAATLLSLLGFSSCGSEIDEPCLYGSPTSSFHVKGNVTAEDGLLISRSSLDRCARKISRYARNDDTGEAVFSFR